jgi:hypothetical protein
MPLLATCAKCQCKLRVRDELAAKSVRCPRCGWTFTVAQEPGGQASAAEASPGDRSIGTSAPPPAQLAEDSADDELLDVPVLKRRRFTRGPVMRLLLAAQKNGTRLVRRWSMWIVVGIVVIALAVLQFGWDRLTGATPNASRSVAHKNVMAPEESSADDDKPSGSDKPADPNQVVATDSATGQKAAPLARVKEGAKAGPDKTRPASNESGSMAGQSSHVGPPRADADQGQSARPRPAAARAPAGGAVFATPRPAQPTLPPHTGPYTPENPPRIGEVVVVRLKDGLHVGKVTSVDLENRQCELTVLESAAYNQRGEVRETKRNDTARFGQLRVPHPPKHSPPKDPPFRG